MSPRKADCIGQLHALDLIGRLCIKPGIICAYYKVSDSIWSAGTDGLCHRQSHCIESRMPMQSTQERAMPQHP